MMRSIGLALMAMISALGAALGGQEGEHTTEPLAQIKEKVESKKAILVDVRERREWDGGHIKGAVFLPLSQLTVWERDGIGEAEKAELARKLPKGSVVYCHCAAGARSLPGAGALKKLGYDARPLKPGYRDLIEAGFPRETPK